MKKIFLFFLAAATFSACDEENIDNDMTVDFESTIFTSNNTDGNVRFYSVDNSGNVTNEMEVMKSSTAADGVYYDEDADEIIQASRSELGIDLTTDASTAIAAGVAETQTFGEGDMKSPREAAVKGNFIVVADNADVDGDNQTLDGRLFIYNRTSDGVMLRNVITTDFKLWGIIFIGNDLYAVVDADDELAVFNDFLDNTESMMLSADKRVVVEGIVRTHGLDYDEATDIMVMTDIGDAGNTEDDGGFHLIENFSDVFSNTMNGDMITLVNQTRVAGSNTMMGNPVDVAYDGANDIVYVAEIGNGGGRLLSFNNAKSGGNLTPTSNVAISKVSCVYLNK